MRQRDWAKLDQSWYLNKKVRKVLRRYGPVAGAYWTMLIGLAYASSHHIDNPSGTIDCSLADLADYLCDEHDRVEMWEAMIDAKLLRITGGDWEHDNEAAITVELIDFTGWQHPRLSAARRKLEQRDKEKSTFLQGNVTGASQHVTKRHPDRDRDRDRDKPPTPSAPARTSAPAPTREAHPAITTAIKTLAAHIQEDEEVWTDRIFVWWSANSHTTEGDLVAALLAVTTQPREKLKNPYRYFQTIVKRENGETRKVDQQVAEAAKRETGTDRQRPWQEVWAERLKEIEDKERGKKA